MLGFDGIGVFLAYTLSIAAGIVCVMYGIKNWNSPTENIVSHELDEENRSESTYP